MSVYWVMFLLPVWGAMFPLRTAPQLRRAIWLAAGVLYILIVGLRHEVGADWDAYLVHLNDATEITLLESLMIHDPAYGVLNWLAAQLGLGIYGVNLGCSAVFTIGVFCFCRRQPMPWLALIVVVPYLMVVVAMGYTRQGAAIGLVFLSLTWLADGQTKRYVVAVVAAALFHKTALVMLPFGLISNQPKGKVIRLLLISVMGGTFGVVLLQAHYEALWDSYITGQMESGGAAIRILMNVAAAIAMLLVWKRWRNRYADNRIWSWMAIFSIVSLCIYPLASTAVDRLNLYLAPLQVAVFSRLPILIQERSNRVLVVMGLLVGYAAVLWIWLNFGNFSPYWIPYKMVFFAP